MPTDKQQESHRGNDRSRRRFWRRRRNAERNNYQTRRRNEKAANNQSEATRSIHQKRIITRKSSQTSTNLERGSEASITPVGDHRKKAWCESWQLRIASRLRVKPGRQTLPTSATAPSPGAIWRGEKGLEQKNRPASGNQLHKTVVITAVINIIAGCVHIHQLRRLRDNWPCMRNRRTDILLPIIISSKIVITTILWTRLQRRDQILFSEEILERIQGGSIQTVEHDASSNDRRYNVQFNGEADGGIQSFNFNTLKLTLI